MKILWLPAAAIAAITVASMVPSPYAAARQVASSGAPLIPSEQFAPKEVQTIQRACGNCHSNETVWPWYSHVAPVSWLVRKDVSEGREFLNFSRWADYGPAGQSQLLAAAAGQIKDEGMPPKRYLLLHPEAKLIDRERSALIAAFERESARLSQSVKSNQ